MKILYFDGESGVAGDMILGALIHLGLDPNDLTELLQPIAPANFTIRVDDVSIYGIASKRVTVEVGDEPKHRNVAQIEELLDKGKLSSNVRTRISCVLHRLAAAEARVHNSTPEKIHFHEVGMTDAIVDIVGSVWGMERLGIEAVLSAPLVLGSGHGRSAHGPIIYPAPAVMEILRGLPVRVETGIGETTTPTGAAIFAEVAEFTDDVSMRCEAFGYGAGHREFADRPNLLRATFGDENGYYDSDRVWLAASDIDNTRPEVFDWLADRLWDAGAIDVTFTDVAMKKGRRGIRVEALCPADRREAIADTILTETGSLGVRWIQVARTKLQRRTETVSTEWGPIRIKVALTARGERGIPEYDDCHRAAKDNGVPLQTVIETATQIFAHRLGQPRDND
jgi:uncharacterized protein (TIGR00299 family) protein